MLGQLCPYLFALVMDEVTRNIQRDIPWCMLFADDVVLVDESQKKRAYPVQRAPALCGVWRRMLVASPTLACAMRGDRDSNPGPSGHRRE